MTWGEIGRRLWALVRTWAIGVRRRLRRRLIRRRVHRRLDALAARSVESGRGAERMASSLPVSMARTNTTIGGGYFLPGQIGAPIRVGSARYVDDVWIVDGRAVAQERNAD